MTRSKLARFAHVVPLIGAGLMMVACQNPADKQRKADETQGAANQQKTEAEQHAQQDMQEAQKKADKEQAEARSSLMKDQSDYRDKIQKALNEDGAKVDAMSAAASHAVGAARTQDMTLVKNATAHRDVLLADLSALSNADSTAWPGLKSKIDSDIDAFHSSVSDASKRIKTARVPAANPNAPHAPKHTP